MADQEIPTSPPVIPPVNVQVESITGEVSPVPSVSPARSSHKILFSVLIFVALMILASTSSTILFAYGMLPIKNADLQNKIVNVLMAIPFMPKTPRFVLESSANAHLKITKFSFDTSIAADSSSLNSLLKIGSFDARITGKIDYTDIKKPLLELNAQVTKDFSSDLRIKDQTSFFRINKIPALVAVMLDNYGFTENIQKQVFGKWIYIDSKPLNTDARTSLDNTKSSESTIQQGFKDYLDAFNNPEILKSLSMTEEKLGTLGVYHVYFAPNDSVLNVFWDKYTQKVQNKTASQPKTNYKISDSVKDFVVNIWIDRNTYLIQKSSVKFVAKSASNGSANMISPLGMLSTQKQDIPIFISVQLSDFNSPVVIDTPVGAVKFDDLFKSLMAQMQAQKSTPTPTPFQSFGAKKALPRTQ